MTTPHRLGAKRKQRIPHIRITPEGVVQDLDTRKDVGSAWIWHRWYTPEQERQVRMWRWVWEAVIDAVGHHIIEIMSSGPSQIELFSVFFVPVQSGDLIERVTDSIRRVKSGLELSFPLSNIDASRHVTEIEPGGTVGTVLTIKATFDPYDHHPETVAERFRDLIVEENLNEHLYDQFAE